MDNLSQLDDYELVKICMERTGIDERPFSEIFHRYHEFVIRVLHRYFSNHHDVEDLAQEVFFKAYRNFSGFEGGSSLKTWLFRIAANTAKNELRQRSRRPVFIEKAIQELEEYFPDVIASQTNRLIPDRQNFDYVLSRLSPKEQEILILKDVEEYSYKEIASRLNITVSAAKMRVQRSRMTMKKLLQESTNDQ